jgi:hypothetical protein
MLNFKSSYSYSLLHHAPLRYEQSDFPLRYDQSEFVTPVEITMGLFCSMVKIFEVSH